MSEIKLFCNTDLGEIRVLEYENKIYAVGNDVAKILEYARPHEAITAHCKGAVSYRILTEGGCQTVKIIPEGDIYRLIVKASTQSRNENIQKKAERFESWVFDEVLPTIRKTGGYVANEDSFINTYLPNADEQTKLMFKSQLEVIRNLNNRIEADKPKVLFAEAVDTAKTSILVGDLAKLLKQNGIDIGQKRLFKWLRENGYLMKNGDSKNMPTQKAMELNLFEVKERTINNPDGSSRITRTTKVTGKGQIYFINKFIA